MTAKTIRQRLADKRRNDRHRRKLTRRYGQVRGFLIYIGLLTER